MARPTNKDRVLRLLTTFGRLPLVEVRTALGPGADTAILDLIVSGQVSMVAIVRDLEGAGSVLDWGKVPPHGEFHVEAR